MILHGVNMVYKVGDYRPASSGFCADDARFLKRHGFNTVRLGIIYKGLEPKPPRNGKPRYSEAYLRSIAAHRRRCSRATASSPCSTSTRTSTTSASRARAGPIGRSLDDGLPSEPQQGFPLNYLVNAGLNRAFDNFWANDTVEGRPLQSAYAAAWRHVARALPRRAAGSSATTC